MGRDPCASDTARPGSLRVPNLVRKMLLTPLRTQQAHQSQDLVVPAQSLSGTWHMCAP